MILLIFLLAAFGGAWLVALPLWLSADGLASPLVTRCRPGHDVHAVRSRADGVVGVPPPWRAGVPHTIPALGEERGWRGWLLPRLLPLGTARAVIISGVIWGLWHAPLTLLGYNYPNLGAWAAAMFVPFCVLFGGLLGWVRLRSGSVWPAAVGQTCRQRLGRCDPGRRGHR